MLSLSRLTHRIAVKSRAATERVVYRLRTREDGVAAVEFALIAPIMATMMIGAIEMSAAVTIDRRVSQVAATTGDLAARFDGGTTPADISEVARIGSWILGTKDADKVKITLRLVTARCEPGDTCTSGTSVPVSYAGQKTRWECVFDPAASGAAAEAATPGTYASGAANASATCTCKDEAFTTPRTGLVEHNTSPALVVSDVEFKYTPLFFDTFMSTAYPSAPVGANGLKTFTLTERLYHKPRGAEIKLNPNGTENSGPDTCNLP